MQVAAGGAAFRGPPHAQRPRPAGASPFPRAAPRRRPRPRPLLRCCGPSLAGAGWAPPPRPARPPSPSPAPGARRSTARGAGPAWPGVLGAEALRGLAGLRGGSGPARPGQRGGVGGPPAAGKRKEGARCHSPRSRVGLYPPPARFHGARRRPPGTSRPGGARRMSASSPAVGTVVRD